MSLQSWLMNLNISIRYFCAKPINTTLIDIYNNEMFTEKWKKERNDLLFQSSIVLTLYIHIFIIGNR